MKGVTNHGICGSASKANKPEVFFGGRLLGGQAQSNAEKKITVIHSGTGWVWRQYNYPSTAGGHYNTLAKTS